MTGDDPNDPQSQTIPRDEALGLLRRSPVGRLAVVVDGVPEIFPVNHEVDDGQVVFRTTQDTVMMSAVSQPVALEVDGYDLSRGEAWSVVVHGTGRAVGDTDEGVEALRRRIFPWQGGSKPQVVRIMPGKITGRRFPIRREPQFGDPEFEEDDPG